MPSLFHDPVEERRNDLMMDTACSQEKDIDLFATSAKFLELGSDRWDSWRGHERPEKSRAREQRGCICRHEAPRPMTTASRYPAFRH